jgi:two-component system sensor kinase FixL
VTIRRGTISFANDAFFGLSGLNAADVIGAALRDVLERIAASPKAIGLLTASNPGDFSVEVVRDGDRRRIFRMHRFRVDDAAPPPNHDPSANHDGEDRAGLDAVMFIDDTLWRETKHASEVLVEQLLRADRHAALGEMAMALAHEINQPLGAIVNFAGAARRTLKGRALRVNELDEVLQNIGAEAARAGDVIKSLRSFLRGTPLLAHSADVNAAVKVVLGLAEPAMREHSIAAEVDLASDLPPVQADQIILQQIVLNLVTNAIQAVQDQPLPLRQLAIATFIEGDNLAAIAVRDTGIGLPRDLGEAIFEPFVTTKENGSGLGLSIARTLAQRLGGSIEALPAASHGACFTIRLPCRSVEAQLHA